jgi:chromosome segregation ATPase
LLATGRAVERCTPAELLVRMSTAFDAVRQTIGEARDVYEVLVPRLRDLRTQLLELTSAAPDLDLADVDPSRLEEQQRELAEQALTDPFAVDRERVDQLAAAVATATQVATARRELRTRGADRIAAARARCRQLHQLVDESAELRESVVARVRIPAAPAPVAIDPDIDARLQLVEPLMARGDWRAAQRELASVEEQVAAAVTDVGARTAAMRSILEERRRLRGLLDAYTAKAAALHRLEDPRVAQRSRAAHDALYVAPSDLDAARALIAEYRQAVEGVATGAPAREVPR